MQKPTDWKFAGWYVQFGSKWRLYYNNPDAGYCYFKEEWSIDGYGKWVWNNSNGFLSADEWVWAKGFSTASYCGKDTYALTSGWGIYGSNIYHFDSSGYLDREY